jgi:hypothetical protein
LAADLHLREREKEGGREGGREGGTLDADIGGVQGLGFKI